MRVRLSFEQIAWRGVGCSQCFGIFDPGGLSAVSRQSLDGLLGTITIFGIVEFSTNKRQQPSPPFKRTVPFVCDVDVAVRIERSQADSAGQVQSDFCYTADQSHTMNRRPTTF